MARSLNTLADHRANFMHWWKAAMDEARALRKLHEAAIPDLRDEALEELRRAALAQVQQLNGLRGQLLQEADDLEALSQRLGQAAPGDLVRETKELEHRAQTIRTLLQVTA